MVAPAVELEPCAEFRADPDVGVFCDQCGWTADDHTSPWVSAGHSRT